MAAEDPFQQSTIQNLDALADLIWRMDAALHGSDGQASANPSQSLNLDPLTALFYAAELAFVAAENAVSLRNGLKQNDQINEEDTWPNPRPLTITDPVDLWRTISMTSLMDSRTFEMITTFYKKFPSSSSGRKPETTLHGVLLELVLIGIRFMEAEKKAKEFPYRAVHIEQPPPMPTPKAPGSSAMPALQKLECSLRRMLQAHMQMAVFIPAHLRHAVATARSSGIRAAAGGNEDLSLEIPTKFDPKPDHGQHHPHGDEG
jgi:hypothetical protein